MKNLKRILALSLAGALALTTVACGGAKGGSASTYDDNRDYSLDEARELTIGSWWREYYDSSDESIDVSKDWTGAQFADDDTEDKHAEKAVNQQIAQKKWDNVSKVESKYNCTYKWVNLTYEGTKESINTSVLAGSPDCDIYMVDPAMGVPAQSNGLLVDLKEYLPEDDDIFTDQKVFSYLDLGDGKACLIKVNGGMSNTYPLAFNKQLLEANNLEDPNALYERGEWTWDKFLEYCEKLTQDTDGDGQIDQYGFCGFVKDTFAQLLMANGAAIAGGKTQTLTSPEVGEALDMLQKLYSPTYSCPYESYADGHDPSNSMRLEQYNKGNVGFFPVAVWIQDTNGNYPMDEGGQGNLNWDVVYVRWPVGPSGDAATNPGYNASDGNFFCIPAGVEDPVKVYKILYDIYNWYEGDRTLPDDPAAAAWWYHSTANKTELKDHNYAIQKECLSKPGFELYDSVGIEMNLEELIAGTATPAQVQETWSQAYQDALDSTFGN